LGGNVGRLSDDFITGGVTMTIVNTLEVVNVKNDNGCFIFVALQTIKFLNKVGFPGFTVE